MKNTISDSVMKYSIQASELVGDIKRGVNRALAPVVGASVILAGGNAIAADAATTSSAALEEVGTMFGDAMLMGLALISAVVFVIVAWAVVTKFNDARRGRADWGEVVLPFIIGAGCVIFIGWLVGEGETAAGNIAGGTTTN